MLDSAVADTPVRSHQRDVVPDQAGLRVTAPPDEDHESVRAGCDARPRRGRAGFRTRPDRKRGVGLSGLAGQDVGLHVLCLPVPDARLGAKLDLAGSAAPLRVQQRLPEVRLGRPDSRHGTPQCNTGRDAIPNSVSVPTWLAPPHSRSLPSEQLPRVRRPCRIFVPQQLRRRAAALPWPIAAARRETAPPIGR